MITFSVVYSFWWLILFGIIAFGFTFLFYSKYSKNELFSKKTLLFLSFLRFINLFFLFFILLSPILETLTEKLQKPILFIAQDNSESILVHEDKKEAFKKEYEKKITDLQDKLSDKFEVESYLFGNSIAKLDSINFNVKQTDISAVLQYTIDNYNTRKLAALVLLSDGLYNKGTNPLYQSKLIDYPIYSLALGDSNIIKDLRIADLQSNELSFLGNKFPIKIILDSKKLQGKKTVLQIRHKNELIYTEEIDILTDDYLQTTLVELEAKTVGIQQYRVSLSVLEGEKNTINNVRNLNIRVIESKQKILLLTESAHPDIAALRSVFQESKNFEFEVANINHFSGKISEYSLLIISKLPSTNNHLSSVLDAAAKSKISVLFTLGLGVDYQKFNNLNLGVKVKQKNNTFEQSQAYFNNKFLYFEISEELKMFVEKSANLTVAFGDIEFQSKKSILFSQKIKNIKTNSALIGFNINPKTGNKQGFIFGEGIWKWRLDDYLVNKNHDLSNELLQKIVHYLSINVQNERFVVNYEQIKEENQEISFSAEVYNESFELVTNGELQMKVYNSDNHEYSYVFSHESKNFNLNVGLFPVGDYRFEIKTNGFDQQFVKKGTFKVTELQVENENTVANYELMYQLANRTGGRFYSYPNIDSIAEYLLKDEKIKPIYKVNRDFEEIINLKWIFILIVLFLSIEWFIRKYLGSY